MVIHKLGDSGADSLQPSSMADWGEVESPRGDSNTAKMDDAAVADIQAVAASLATMPGPVNFSGVLAIADSLPVMIAYLDRQERYMFLNRTLAWDADFEAKIRALTPEQIVATLRRHLDMTKVTIVKAGDFKKTASSLVRPER